MVEIQLLLATPPSKMSKRTRTQSESINTEKSPLKVQKKVLVTPELSSPARYDDAPCESTLKIQVQLTEPCPNNKNSSTIEVEATSPVISLNPKQTEKLEKGKQRELQRELIKKEKEQKKEEERLRKEQERLVKIAEKEAQKQAKLAEKEAEKQAKIAEKEAEKQARRQKLEQEKHRREQIKEEERLKKQAEKEEREKQKLERKLAAEEEKKRAEEERKRQEEAKERSQMKIMSFFQKKPPTSQKNDSIDVIPVTANEGEPLSLVYDKMFLPFFKKTTATVYESLFNKFDAAAKNKELEAMLALTTHELKSELKADDNCADLISIFGKFSNFNPEITQKVTHTSPEEVVQVLNSSQATEDKLCQLLLGLGPVKYIQFYENSRPPYIGTWSSKSHSIKFPRLEPLNTSLTGMDYDYDSDIDWNIDEDAEGEGEDIDNEDDEDDEDEDPSMLHDEDDFVDFDDPQKKKKFIGPLVSISIWNDGNDEQFFNKMAYVPVAPTITFPIDPVVNVKAQITTIPTGCTTESGGPGTPSKITKTVVNTLTPQKPKIEDKQVLEELKTFIQDNNDFSIGTLVELAHKKIKTYTKIIIKRTIQDISIYNKKTGKWELRTELIVKKD